MLAYRTKSNFNSSPPSAAYMRQWTGPALVQVMAWRLFGAKPSPEPMQAYHQLDSREQILVKFYHFSGILSFSFKKVHLKLSSAKMAAILSRGRWVKKKVNGHEDDICKSDQKTIYSAAKIHLRLVHIEENSVYYHKSSQNRRINQHISGIYIHIFDDEGCLLVCSCLECVRTSNLIVHGHFLCILPEDI